MIYIYNCYGGTHSSSLASAVHLKKLPADRIPTDDEILNTPYFNKLTYKDMGRIIYRGDDEEGNKIFTVGRGTSRVLVPCLKNLIDVLQSDCGLNEKIILSNMSPAVPFAMTMGGFFSRGLGIDSVGVPLLILGAKQAYPKVIEFVQNTKNIAKESNEKVIVLMNTKRQKSGY
ncbi:MAG: DUF3189 family protein [Clostridia bacterium]|nr:DUF3189 family protein [Clostridia bacterium]